MKNKPMKLGFKKLPHAEKMVAKKAHRAQLAALPYADPKVGQRIAFRGAMIRNMNARNGVGRPPAKGET